MSSTIGELSLATGVPIATLRDWDRRHGLSPSQRTIGNHRRYTDTDAELVRRVRDLVAGGLRLRASVTQARVDQQQSLRPRQDAQQLATDHARLRSDLAASRDSFVARRDELVAERAQLVAHRRSLVSQHGATIASLNQEFGTPQSTATDDDAVPVRHP